MRLSNTTMIHGICTRWYRTSTNSLTQVCAQRNLSRLILSLIAFPCLVCTYEIPLLRSSRPPRVTIDLRQKAGNSVNKCKIYNRNRPNLPRPILEFQNRTVRFINSSFNTYVFQKLWSLFRKILWTIYKKNKINYVSLPCFSLILPLWGTESISKKRIRFGKIQNRVLGTIIKFFIRRDVRIAVVILQRNDVRHA